MLPAGVCVTGVIVRCFRRFKAVTILGRKQHLMWLKVCEYVGWQVNKTVGLPTHQRCQSQESMYSITGSLPRKPSDQKACRVYLGWHCSMCASCSHQHVATDMAHLLAAAKRCLCRHNQSMTAPLGSSTTSQSTILCLLYKTTVVSSHQQQKNQCSSLPSLHALLRESLAL